MHILKYDIPIIILVISKGLSLFYKMNLSSLKLSGNKESQIRPLKVSLGQEAKLMSCPIVSGYENRFLLNLCKYIYCHEK